MLGSSGIPAKARKEHSWTDGKSGRSYVNHGRMAIISHIKMRSRESAGKGSTGPHLMGTHCSDRGERVGEEEDGIRVSTLSTLEGRK